MKMTVTRPESGPPVEPELLVNFIIERCRGVTECPSVLASLALAALSQDIDFYDRLKELISSSDSREEILSMSERIFFPALLGSPAPTPDDSNDLEGYRATDEALHQTVLSFALQEGRNMLSSGNYYFIGVFELLTRAGLGCYSYRLYQFMDACERFRNDSESLIREGIEIIDLVTTSTANQN